MAENILKGVNVLIIEDEYLVALEAQRIVEAAGAGHVVIATTLESAEAAVSGDDVFNVVIVDLRLGENPGGPLAERLAERGMALIFATGLADDSLIPDAVRSAPIIGKPYSEIELVRALATALNLAQPS